MALTKIPNNLITADAIDGTLIANNAINSEHYTDGSIDTVHIGADQITADLIADDAVGSEHIQDNNILTAAIGNDQVTTAKINDGDITNALMADDAIGIAELSATGSASSSTYLRGDNSWAAISSSPITALNNATANELVTVGSTTTELDSESGLTFDGTTLGLNATGDIGIHIRADTDNSGEGDNPFLSFGQDGSSAKQFYMGLEGVAGTQATGTLSNAAFIRANNDATQPLQLAHMDSVVATFRSGNVGINTSSPDYKLTIQGSGTTMNDGSGACLQVHSTDNTTSMVMLGSAADPNAAGIGYHRGNSRLWITAGGGSESASSGAFTLNGAGNVTIGTTSVINNARLTVDNPGGEVGISLSEDGTSNTAIWGLTALNAIGTRTNHPFVLRTNDTDRMIISNSGNISTYPPAGNHFVINENGVDSDFRVESDGNPHMISVDGGNNRVGIGGAPSSHTLEVTGTISGNAGIYAATMFQITGGRYWTFRESGNDCQIYSGSNGAVPLEIKNDGTIIIDNIASSSGAGTAGVIAHHTNNNMYIRGGTESLVLGGGSSSEASRGSISIPEGNNNMDFKISDTTRFRVRHDGMTFMGPNTSGQMHVSYNSSYVTMADDATITLSSVANTGCLISIGSYRKSGQNVAYAHALIFLGYHIGTTAGTIIADPVGFLRNSDTDGYMCVYKTAGNGNVTVKNRLGISNNVSITIHRYLGN